MKKLFIGLIVGMLVAGTVAWAIGTFRLVDDDGAAFGTAANPIVVQF